MKKMIEVHYCDHEGCNEIVGRNEATEHLDNMYRCQICKGEFCYSHTNKDIVVKIKGRSYGDDESSVMIICEACRAQLPDDGDELLQLCHQLTNEAIGDYLAQDLNIRRHNTEQKETEMIEDTVHPTILSLAAAAAKVRNE